MPLDPIHATGFVRFQFCKKPICVLESSQVQGLIDTKFWGFEVRIREIKIGFRLYSLD